MAFVIGSEILSSSKKLEVIGSCASKPRQMSWPFWPPLATQRFTSQICGLQLLRSATCLQEVFHFLLGSAWAVVVNYQMGIRNPSFEMLMIVGTI